MSFAAYRLILTLLLIAGALSPEPASGVDHTGLSVSSEENRRSEFVGPVLLTAVTEVDPVSETVQSSEGELEPGDNSRPSPADSAVLLITSIPEGGMILMDGVPIDPTTPVEIVVSSAKHTVEVMLEGYEPLADTVDLEQGTGLKAEFKLRPEAPQPLTPDSLGMEHLPTLKPIDEKTADLVRKRWTELSWTFAIVPLGQGVLARVALPEEHHGKADVLIVSGAVLTVASWITGKILYKRKLKQIRAYNEEIPRSNEVARAHNQEVDEMIAQANASAVENWLTEVTGTGVVTVTPLGP